MRGRLARRVRETVNGLAGRPAPRPGPTSHLYGITDTLIADEASVQSDPSGTVAALSFRLGATGPRAPFRLERRAEGGCTILAVTGQLDLASSGEFGGAVGELIAATPGLRLILDLTGLAGWDSSGMAALITAQQRIDRDRSARMIVACGPGPLAAIRS